MTEPKFKRGDLVRHRASGEVAVVVGANCSEPNGGETYLHRVEGSSLEGYEFTGTYDLDLGFKQDVLCAEEYLLEAVEAERGNEP